MNTATRLPACLPPYVTFPTVDGMTFTVKTEDLLRAYEKLVAQLCADEPHEDLTNAPT